jgi:LPS-assembly protein
MASATAPRPPPRWRARLRARLRTSAVRVVAAGALCTTFAVPAVAQQWVGVPPGSANAPSIGIPSGQRDPNAQMFVQANEIQYDYSGERVSAVGGVQIHYSGSVLEADRVIYDQRSKTLTAEGNVRLTGSDGAITTDRLQLDDQFRNGFIDSLHVETVERTRLAAQRADIEEAPGGGRYTVFQSGVYTACEPCKENPQRPPKWQVKAARILHDEQEKTIYFEDMRLEMFGVPIAYLPYFWMPDPSVKKKTGLLRPTVLSSRFLGTGIQAPFFWNIAPDYDVTFAPAYLSRQGLLMSAEWRQRLLNGAYGIRGVGIFQQDRTAFAGTVGDRDFRGAIETKGDFRLSRNWWFGWDVSLFTDNQFAPQYKVTQHGQEAISQAYLFGRGEYSYFDLRGLHFYGLSALDNQSQLPILHPLLNYRYRFAHPIFGGELSYHVNLASLTRQTPDYDAINLAAARTTDPVTGLWLFNDGKNVCDSADPAAVKNAANCLLRGVPGTYTRLSAEVLWRRTIIDPYGQMFTPFVWARADAAAMSLTPDPYIANFIDPNRNSAGRITPAVGIDYRYPFISTHSWGTQIIEPRAQIIARPSEMGIGNFPNEDSQALMFGDDNLFSISKFPGYDRVEGGGRANVGIQYTAQFNQGGYLNAIFGQSYHLFGANSYAVGDMANTGINSGLDTDRSDYVARVTFRPNSTYALISRFRFDEQTFETRRLEVEGRVNFERWQFAMTYGKYDAQPEIGMLLPREGVRAAGSIKLTPNWSITGNALYSIDSERLTSIGVGLAYIDECLAISAVFQRNYGYRGDIVPNETLLVRLSLRTLGDVSYSQVVGGPGGGTGLWGPLGGN